MGNSCFSDQKQNSQDANLPPTQGRAMLNPTFTADVRSLHQRYVQLVLYVRDTRLFESRTDRLVSAVHKYFQS